MADHTSPKRAPRTLLDPEELKRLYVERGLPEYEVAERLGTSRYLVSRNLFWYGIQRRGVSEANVLRFTNNPSERDRAASHARQFFTGRPQTDEMRHQIAKTVHMNQKQVSHYERQVHDRLKELGLAVELLWPLDRWNIDIAIPDVLLAVEIHGGWHDAPKKRDQDRRKAEYLKEQGWTLLVFNRNGFSSASRPTPSQFVGLIVHGVLTAHNDITDAEVTS